MARKFEVRSGNPWRDAGGRFASPSKSQYTKFHSKDEKKNKTKEKEDIYEGKDLYDKYVFPDGNVALVSVDKETLTWNYDKKFKLADPIKWLENKTGYKNIDRFKVNVYNIGKRR